MDFQPGDILGFSGHAWSSAGINLVTYGIPFWDLSHVAIVGRFDGELLLFESECDPQHPCAIQGQLFAGTQAQPIDSRLQSYRGKVWHYPIYRKLYRSETERLNRFLYQHLGIPYDRIGAFRSGGIGWSWIESLLRQSDLSSLFCSELAAAAHTHIGLFRTDNVSRWSPNRFVRAERRAHILLKPRRLK
jgi:hypothetical protein